MVALMPLMTLKNFSGTAYQVSLIETLFGAGMLAGGALLGVWNPKIRKTLLIAISYFCLVRHWHFVEYFRLMVLYFCSINSGTRYSCPIFSGPFTSLLQTQFKPAYLGRVFSLFDSVSLLPSIIGLFITGFIADSLGIANIFICCGIAIVFTSILMMCIPAVRDLEKQSK